MSHITVAFQGEPGAYSEAAAIEFFSTRVITIPCRSFDDVFSTVSNGNIQYGMIPIENSLAGSIHRNYDLLLRNGLHIVGEYHLRINHCLLALPGVSIADVVRVQSHPQALAQCEISLARLKVNQIMESDTAGSARLLRERNDRHAAVLASRHAAEVYQLNILIENMEDNPANYTRFLVLSRHDVDNLEVTTEEYKTSIVFSLRNLPGALFKALSVFALRDIDLTKIESRPIHGKPWEYIFYIDFIGRSSDPICQRALDHLQELATVFRILGSYQRHIMSV